MTEAEKVEGLELVEHYREMLGPDTDFDEYTFSIKRGNLRRLLALYAHPPAQAPNDAEAMREACARLVEKRRDNRFAEFGTTEEELYEEDEEIAAAIRTIPLPKAKAAGDMVLLPSVMTAAMINAWSNGLTVTSDDVALRTTFQDAWKRVIAAANPKAGGEEG